MSITRTNKYRSTQRGRALCLVHCPKQIAHCSQLMIGVASCTPGNGSLGLSGTAKKKSSFPGRRSMHGLPSDILNLSSPSLISSREIFVATSQDMSGPGMPNMRPTREKA